MARKRPIPRLISKRQKKYWRMPKRYHVTIADDYWEKQYPLWQDLPAQQQQDLRNQDIENIRLFLDLERPIRTTTELLVSGPEIRIGRKGNYGPVVITPLI